MRDENTHEKSGAVIRTGQVPNRTPARMWGGPGSGAECTICGVAVAHDEIEIELAFALDDGGGLGRETHHTHRR